MTRITRWHTYGWWALAVVGLVGSVTAVAAQEGRWERVTAAGAQAFAQGDYPEAARLFRAALPLADAGSLAPSLMNVAAVAEAQEDYAEAARLYQRVLVLQEQVLGPDHPQLVPVLEAQAALYRTRHPVRALLPWSPGQQLATRAQRIREREAQALADLPWGPRGARQLVGDGAPGE
jgi:tetratricopeptide (TPR) repeat protein